jgi:hypothetical protein
MELELGILRVKLSDLADYQYTAPKKAYSRNYDK